MKFCQVLAAVLALFAKALGKDRNRDNRRKLITGARPEPAGYNGVRFSHVPVPQLDEGHFTRASSTVTINGETSDIGFKSILKTGDRIGSTAVTTGDRAGSAVAGMLLDIDGDPIYQLVNNNTEKGTFPHLSVNADFVSITTGKDGKQYLMSHWEDAPGQMYASELEIGSSCDIVVKSLFPVDFSAWGGLLLPCAGSVSPWGTHLGSEESDPDARTMQDDWDDHLSYYVLQLRYFKKYPGDLVDYNDFLSIYNPYNYGFVTEVFVDENGVPQATKWLTLGRSSVEHALVMPDNKTVYVTDDTGHHCAFLAFVMDEPGDLSSGTLYTIKMIQEEPFERYFDIEWIPLASATQEELLELKDTITFDDIFLYHDYNNGTCPEGFKAVSRYAVLEVFVECLQLQPGMEKAAAFFETRRYSGYVGGTIELSGLETIAYDEKRSKLYIAISYQDLGMTEGITSGETDDIILHYRGCGCVYQGDYVESEGWLQLETFSPLICGFEPWSPNEDNACDVNTIAGPDNIFYMGNGAGPDILLIAEDSVDGRSNYYVWALDMTTTELTRILTTPWGSEATGTYFFDDVDGCAFLISVTQHPYLEGHEDKVNETFSSGTRADIGYIGPLPAFR